MNGLSNKMNESIVKETRAKIKSIIVDDSIIEYYITSSKVIDSAGSNIIEYQNFSEYTILQEKLLPREALNLMKKLWDKMQQNPSSIFYQKYVEDKKRGSFHPSIGGGDINSKDEAERRVVAIAWTNKS
jgi:hypothetical protein